MERRAENSAIQGVHADLAYRASQAIRPCRIRREQDERVCATCNQRWEATEDHECPHDK